MNFKQMKSSIFAYRYVLLQSLIGGLVFLLLFYWGYSGIDKEFYQSRDDGIITLSHSKNWVDYGFIGVNPSGDRIEGHSAPVQFFLYTLLYLLNNKMHYDIYGHWQTIISTFLLGALFIHFFQGNRIKAVILTILSAFLLSRLNTFLEWHGSGMENAITHVLFISSVLMLFLFVKYKKIIYSLAPLLFLATISRIESVWHIAPLLGVFSIFWFVQFRELRGLYFSLVVLVLWSMFHLWRYLYFGELFPHTSLAQGISVTKRLYSFLALERNYLLESLGSTHNIFYRNFAYILFPFLLSVFVLHRKKEVFLLCGFLGSLSLTALFHPFFFGLTRLDRPRANTHLAVFAVLALALICYYFDRNRYLQKKKSCVARMILLFVVFIVSLSFMKQPYDLCCPASSFDRVRKDFARLTEQEQIFRPTAANQDLGVMSWHKQFNILDFACLGSKITTKFRGKAPIFLDYFFDYSAPDMMESHGYLSFVLEPSLFADARFRDLYQPVKENFSKYGFTGGKKVVEGIWIRKDVLKASRSPERKLMDDLRRDLSTNRLRQELEKCQEKSKHSCVYVARTAYRFLPEFRRQGGIGELQAIFSRSRTKAYDLHLINGYKDGNSYHDAVQWISKNHVKKD